MACISSSPLSPSSSPSFSHPDQTLRKSLSKCAGFLSPPPISRFSHSCRCSKSRSDSPSPYDDFIRSPLDSLQDAARSAIRWWSDYLGSSRPKDGDAADAAAGDGKVRESEGGDWDWERWRRHFQEVEEQGRIVSVLKAQLSDAVCREDYEDAAKLKVAIAAAARTDTVGKAISHLHTAVEEERYKDAAFIRDDAGAGLVGWWAGVSEDSSDPYGRIIHISAEHGRYVARSYSYRQLATDTAGVPVFEVFITANDKGEYKQQAVYLKRQRGNFGDDLSKSSEPSSVSSLNSSVDLAEGETDLSAERNTDLEEGEGRDNESDVAEEQAGIQSILRDMIPGFKVNSIKVVATGKIDTDLIFKAFEQDSEEEDDEKDVDLENIEEEEEEEDDDDDDPKAESDTDDIEMKAGGGVRGTTEDGRAMVVKIVIGDLAQKLSNNMPSMDLLRIPASLEKRGRTSFLFSIKKDEKEPKRKGQASISKSTKTSGQRSIDLVMSDLAKVLISREKIPTKVLKDVEELINLTLSQAQKRQPLSGSTIFNRIEIPATSDPLNGLYIGAHGLYTSEVIHLRRRFGQWQEDDGTKKPPGSEFYEYVEAVKLTGDPYVPAGQVAFRAKVGKRNQLPHKGIIPEEFGVVARYRGQGRLAEPGFQNPRWVDGELVILDGKYIKGGPVVGFVYWAPEYHFLVFFNRLKLSN